MGGMQGSARMKGPATWIMDYSYHCIVVEINYSSLSCTNFSLCLEFRSLFGKP